MKRYTARFQLTPSAHLQLKQIETALQRAILHGRAPGIYQIGQVAQVDTEHIFVEIASERKRSELKHCLGDLEQRLSLRLDALNWGWLVTPPQSTVSSLVADPYATISAQTESQHIYQYQLQWTRWLVISGWYILLLTWLVFAVWSLISQERVIQSFAQNLYYLALLLFIAFGMPIRPGPYITYLRCDETGFEVGYKFAHTRLRRLKWQDVVSLEKRWDEWIVQTARQSVRLSVSRISHLDQEATLIKTIIERSNLWLAEDTRRGYVYKRSEAD